MRVKYIYIILSILLLFLNGCEDEKKQQMTPWGTSLEENPDSISEDFNLDDIISNGEIIMLTLNGPENYFDYRGRGLGTQYLLCEKFAQSIGVSLRVEVCKDTTEILNKLIDKEGDIAAINLPTKTLKGLLFCGVKNSNGTTSWAVSKQNKELADTLNRWFKPDMIAQVKREMEWMMSTRSITRHVYSPILNRQAGIISDYDHLFQKYAPVARWDWRLLAAQCYQESTFDPKAKSWAGACGLMQIMPSTADQIGLPRASLFDPEQNIAAATKYIGQLEAKFRDIPDRLERIKFVMACYNGGYNHIRDAMALANKHGGNPKRWNNVSRYVLGLSTPRFYNDPVVKYGYMRGQETVDYVESIFARWNVYRGFAKGGFSSSFGGSMVPQRATKKYRFHI